MLNPEWNSDDGDKAADGPEHVPDRQPDSGEDEPYDVAKRAQGTGADVVRLLEFLPTDGLLTEGEEGEMVTELTAGSGGGGVGAVVTVTVAEADIVESALLVAVILAVPAVAGAV